MRILGACLLRLAPALFAALAACSSAPPPPAAGAPGSKEKPLELIVFPGGFNWPVWVAQDKGLFAANGVTVTGSNAKERPISSRPPSWSLPNAPLAVSSGPMPLIRRVVVLLK